MNRTSSGNKASELTYLPWTNLEMVYIILFCEWMSVGSGKGGGQHLVLTLCENEQTLLRKPDQQGKQQ